MNSVERETFPLISIISLNWNTIDVTSDFLRSINNYCSYPNLEIIIVDNASDIDPTDRFLAIRPDLRIIRNSSNLGFTGGNNVGIKEAKGDYYFIVNNDTEFTPELLEGLLEVFENFPDAGIVSPKFHYFFEKGTIEYAGYHRMNMLTGRNAMVGSHQKDIGQFNNLSVTHFAHGGAMLLPRKIIEKIGGLPEEFIFYYEEFDWCEQVKRLGYKIYYQPKSLIYHKESMSTGKNSPFKTYYLTKNRILFMKRNVPYLYFGLFLIYFTLLTIPKNSLVYLLRGQGAHLKSFWKGILWHFNRSITFN